MGQWVRKVQPRWQLKDKSRDTSNWGMTRREAPRGKWVHRPQRPEDQWAGMGWAVKREWVWAAVGLVWCEQFKYSAGPQNVSREGSPESINVHHLHGIGTYRLIKLRDDPRLSGQVLCHHKGPYNGKREVEKGDVTTDTGRSKHTTLLALKTEEGALSLRKRMGSRSWGRTGAGLSPRAPRRAAPLTLKFHLMCVCMHTCVQTWVWTCVHVRVCAQSLSRVPTLCNPMGWSPPGSSVHEILQARVLEWVAMSSPRGSSRPRDRTQVSVCLLHCRWILYHFTTCEAHFGCLTPELWDDKTVLS